MKELLKTLYDTFYKPLPETKLRQEVEDCHQKLIEALGKPNRHLVLQIIDAKDHIREDISIDSFISGFILAWQLGNEISVYKQPTGYGEDNES